jgi:hypothetical protein
MGPHARQRIEYVFYAALARPGAPPARDHRPTGAELERILDAIHAELTARRDAHRAAQKLAS